MNDANHRPGLRCPVCDQGCTFAFEHPEGLIYRCTACGHVFTDPSSLRGMEKYDAEYFEKAHRNWFNNPDYKLFRWIESALPREARSVIDVGCGRGQFLDFLKDKRPNIVAAGVDIAPNAPRNGITFYRGDIFELSPGQFDCIVSLAVIEHVVDVQGFVARLMQLLRPGGTVVICTVADDSLFFWLARTARLFGFPVIFDRLYSGHHVQHFRRRSLQRLLERHGLRIERRLVHNAPLRAIDTPVMPPLLRPFMSGLLIGLLAAGKLSGRSYLQTVVATNTR